MNYKEGVQDVVVKRTELEIIERMPIVKEHIIKENTEGKHFTFM